jgi:hypothetical protein
VLWDSNPRNLALAAGFWALALGSTWFHWTGSKAGNMADWFGMYMLMSGLSLGSLLARGGGLALGMVMVGVVLASLFAIQRKHFDWHMGVLLVIAAVPAYLYGDRSLVSWSLGVFAVSYGLWWLDKKVMFRGVHGLWHIGTAAAALLMALALPSTVLLP